MLNSRERFIRALTGRVRIQVFGLKRNRLLAEMIYSKFHLLQGILEASPCIVTGRTLITYDERQLSLDQIMKEITILEHCVLFCKPSYSGRCSYSAEVSATVEEVQVSSSPALSIPSWIVTFAAERLGMVANRSSTEIVTKSEKRRILPILSVGRLGALDESKINKTKFSKRREINREPWHAMTREELLQRFSVNEHSGLRNEQVVKLRYQYGLNELEHKKPTPWLFSYLGQFKEFTTLVVLGASVLALLTGDVVDGLAMGIVLLANAAVGNAQERKAERVIEGLNEFQPPKCKVIRENNQFEIDGNELVTNNLYRVKALPYLTFFDS